MGRGALFIETHRKRVKRLSTGAPGSPGFSGIGEKRGIAGDFVFPLDRISGDGYNFKSRGIFSDPESAPEKNTRGE